MRVSTIKSKILCIVLLCSCMFAFGVDKKIAQKAFMLNLTTKANSFVSGTNEFEFWITQDNKVIKASEVKIIFIMPEMPSMPKMSEVAQLSANGDRFNGTITLPHGGTWQIKIIFVIDGKRYQAKSSIDF